MLQSPIIYVDISQVQDGLAQQAEVLAKLATAHDQYRRQVDGNEQVLNALQAVAAKQFQACKLNAQYFVCH